MKKVKIFALLMAMTLGVVAFAGCGGNKEEAKSAVKSEVKSEVKEILVLLPNINDSGRKCRRIIVNKRHKKDSRTIE